MAEEVMKEALLDAAARAAYIAYHANGPTEEGFEAPNMGRGGFKTEVVVWRAVAQAALATAEADIAALRGEVERLREDAAEKDATIRNLLNAVNAYKDALAQSEGDHDPR